MTRHDAPTTVAPVALIALFVTALVTAQLTAAKVLAIPLPGASMLPGPGDAVLLPGAALAYALTFFASDCYAELYGKRAAQVLVNVAFAMNFVLLALVWSTIAAPAAANSPVAGETFAQVLGPSTGIVVGSLLAYLVSQNWDVIVFHRLRDATEGDHLWLRNLGSTATSQAIDTAIFVSVAFVWFQGLPLGTAWALIVGQYALKLLIAAGDTPLVYAVVGWIERDGEQDAAPV
jgi:uncharacterized integral membrane protein (TIGR00697 family)